ncbi:hypothetical protein F5Y12DRAFT_713695 [Xylaria sp. FL1777]|nr:hypothetical protein F5Y12DRAFT_713695 [Xylaria sp. FL1777]
MQSEDERQENPASMFNDKRPRDEDNLPPTESKRRKHDCEAHDGGSSRTRLNVNDYTVGWVCALHIEMAAAKCMLHNIHNNLEKSPDDSNTYIFGSLSQHNIVIACLPMVGYGTNNAAVVASNMRRTFPSIRTFLMVGIGGGAPGKVDIRLGDVVVSTGVIQYDMGKTIQQGHFQATGITRQPLPALMTAVSALRAHHESEPSKIPVILSQMRERYPPMRQYTDREPLKDWLFDSDYDHAESNESCEDCDRSRLVCRSPRSDNNPVIHYGIIASGNKVMKHAGTRDRLAQKLNAICFEMEAAGLMDNFQCLVIRGICDYSDSHKSKEWQKYASATAAAYAKELLSIIPTIGIEATPNRDLIENRHELIMNSLSFEKIYDRHSNIKSAYGKTCAWLLSHPDYIGWLTPAEFPQHHGFLWIYGKPGAGKSTLMKYIYTRALESTDITISFFFNARGDGLEKSTEGMYRSLLFQLLEKLPDLQEVLDRTSHLGQGQNDDGSWQIDDLQRLFSAAVAKLGRRKVTCFIDALDECGETQVRDMVEHFEQLGLCALETEGKLYICFASRHYPTICIQNGRTLTLEDQPGHSRDLEKYVRSKLRAGKDKNVESVRTELLQKAAGVFMWVVLVVNILNEEFQRGRIFAVRKRLQETPTELSALFKDILRRDNKNMPDLLLCIQWILYAKRPLKPEEFYYSVVAGLDPESLTEWDPQHITTDDMKRFVSSSSKGLAEVTKSKAGTVQFIHESVRDFLLKDGGLSDLWPDLEQDFQSHSHEQLKGCCYAYMKTDVSKYVSFNQKLPKASSDSAKALRQQVSEKFPFLEYAIHHVLYHTNMAATDLPQEDFLKTFDLAAWINLDNLLQKFETHRHTPSASLLYILAENNLASLINSMLRYDSRVHIHGERHKYPLVAALANGHYESGKALLQSENITPHDNHITLQLHHEQNFPSLKGLTPLAWAAHRGYTKIVQLLLDQGSNLEVEDSSLQTPLILAAKNGHTKTVQLLCSQGSNLEAADRFHGQTPLMWAAKNGHTETVQLLCSQGSNLEAPDSSHGRTPLMWAAIYGHTEIIQLLCSQGANLEAKNCYSETPLMWAAEDGRTETVQLLCSQGANLEAKDKFGHTPLILAAKNGHIETAQLLSILQGD